MKATVIITFDYEISDDPEMRRTMYGTDDPHECAEIDALNSVEDLLIIADAAPEVVIEVRE